MKKKQTNDSKLHETSRNAKKKFDLDLNEKFKFDLSKLGQGHRGSNSCDIFPLCTCIPKRKRLGRLCGKLSRGDRTGRTDARTHGRTDARTDGRTHGRTDGRTRKHNPPVCYAKRGDNYPVIVTLMKKTSGVISNGYTKRGRENKSEPLSY